MTLENLLGNEGSKARFNKIADPMFLGLGANIGYLWGANKLLDFVSQNVDSNEGLAMAGTYALLTAGLIVLNKYAIFPLARKIRDYNQRRINSKVPANKTGLLRSLATMIALPTLCSLGNIEQTLDGYQGDGERIIAAFAREQPEEIEEAEELLDETPRSLENEIPRSSRKNEIVESNKHSMRGKFLRTYRWDSIISKTEKKYGIEKGLLAGLAMRESYGNPLQLNESSDGGAGLMMFQPGTARQYGLKIYSKSRASGRDRNHGYKLKKLVKKHKWNYETLAGIDERFDVAKSLVAAAKLLKNEYNRHKSWDEALSAYNRGSPARKPSKTPHVKGVREAQKYYNTHRKS